MSSQQGGSFGDRPSGDAGAASGDPTDEERLRSQQAAYEAELSRISATDMIAQAAVSLLNIGARRLAPPNAAPESGAAGAAAAGAAAQRDLEQARDAIDAVKALLDILERTIPQELGPLRDALSRLQMAYAREVPAGAAGAAEQRSGGEGGAQTPPAAGRQTPPGGAPGGPGPAESSGRLWVPGR